MKMDVIKELNLLIQMHYSGDIDSRDEWLREIIYLKSRFESKVNNVVLDDVIGSFWSDDAITRLKAEYFEKGLKGK